MLSTATSISNRFISKPLAVRRGCALAVLAVSACTSTSSGRVPSMVTATAEPGVPALRSAKDARDALAAVAAAVAEGEMLPGEGEAVVKLREAYARTAAAAELEERVAALEGRLADA